MKLCDDSVNTVDPTGAVGKNLDLCTFDIDFQKIDTVQAELLH